jgi:hypothetical protein
VRADHDNVLQAGAKGFERLHRIIVQEQQGAMKGQRTRRREREFDADAATRE